MPYTNQTIEIMEIEFTKGEWEVNEKIPTRIECEGNLVAVVLDSTNEGRIIDETKANSKLIAAAPEMFKFISDFAEIFKDHHAAKDAVAIIKKATE